MKIGLRGDGASTDSLSTFSLIDPSNYKPLAHSFYLSHFSTNVAGWVVLAVVLPFATPSQSYSGTSRNQRENLLLSLSLQFSLCPPRPLRVSLQRKIDKPADSRHPSHIVHPIPFAVTIVGNFYL